jgi:hypothetical protein
MGTGQYQVHKLLMFFDVFTHIATICRLPFKGKVKGKDYP